MTARQWAAGITALLVLLALAFSAGRFSAPERVDVREVEKVLWKDRIVEKVVTKKAKAVDRVVYVDRVVMPNGEIREKTSTRTITDARELVNTDKASESEGKADSSKATVTTDRPDWRVGVLVGASIRDPLLPLAGPLVIGASVERRIIGGVSAGAWVNTGGSAGAAVSVEF